MDERTEYVEKLSAQMVEWDAQIDLLKDKAKSVIAGSGADYSKAIELLQRKRDEAAVKLQGISTANGDEWTELKTGVDRVWGEVSATLRDAVMKIK
ncbi:hypothetical protein F6V25_15235 [Oryzomonas japonica]|uniref:Coiled coil domain-containing protein n=1 Tax=Oryzomonas japonica TaxID=2603858 RepID=A0A7J4ZM65_9BACT|nr:hypothetical protein [Oryzomonas japonica]KAB0663784.1 hypothetical protein F6V25_15235 [Oryzomonas japonica]